jgi:hypothetical protein
MRIQGGIPVGGNIAGVEGIYPDATIAGSPGYRPSEKEINDRLFRYGLERNPQMQQNIQRIREMIRNTSPVQSASVFNNIGNTGGLMSSDMPPGFQNKLVF